MKYPDFEEFIGALEAHEVRYLIVGAHALAFHARPRATKDLDVLLERSEDNAVRTLAAIQSFFGGVNLEYTPEDLTTPGWHLQLGVAPVRIDLPTGIAGITDFEAAWNARDVSLFGDQTANFLSRTDLIVAKRASGRPQGLADLDVLQQTQDRQKPE